MSSIMMDCKMVHHRAMAAVPCKSGTVLQLLLRHAIFRPYLKEKMKRTKKRSISIACFIHCICRAMKLFFYSVSY